MFTLAQIDEIHDSLGKADSLPAYLRALNAIGVRTSDSYLTDGHTDHHGVDGHTVSTPPAHETYEVAPTADPGRVAEALQISDYFEMSKALAACGVEKWTFDTTALTLTYYDKAGNQLLQEALG
ncbi:DUF1398 family protein [Kribbella sp. NPDC051770]|uniref:DUF1398 family protein n=1 Tax=Kribbella sp. NPDC051770 TaxID=3155413 RepID=UPI00343094D9